MYLQLELLLVDVLRAGGEDDVRVQAASLLADRHGLSGVVAVARNHDTAHAALAGQHLDALAVLAHERELGRLVLQPASHQPAAVSAATAE